MPKHDKNIIKKQVLLLNFWLQRIFNDNNSKNQNKNNNIMTGGGAYKWTTLEHNGVFFPPLYKSHGKPLKYNGENIKLSDKAEESAMLYAKYVGSEYIESKTFNRNFWFL